MWVRLTCAPNSAHALLHPLRLFLVTHCCARQGAPPISENSKGHVSLTWRHEVPGEGDDGFVVAVAKHGRQQEWHQVKAPDLGPAQRQTVDAHRDASSGPCASGCNRQGNSRTNLTLNAAGPGPGVTVNTHWQEVRRQHLRANFGSKFETCESF